MAEIDLKPERSITFSCGLSFELHQGDITRMRSDAIVNAANENLKHGGGVAGVIARKGGPLIQRESDAWVAKYGAIDSRHPAYTSSGDLPFKYVIHAVGPIWGEGDEDRKLREAILSALSLAERLKVSSVSFPAISTGIFGFPRRRAADIFMRSIRQFSADFTGESLKNILLVLFDSNSLQDFLSAFDAFTWEK